MMEESEYWTIFHHYNRLVRDGKAKPLICSRCENQLNVVIGKDDNPALKCYPCNTLTRPGLDMYSRLGEIVNQHYSKDTND